MQNNKLPEKWAIKGSEEFRRYLIDKEASTGVVSNVWGDNDAYYYPGGKNGYWNFVDKLPNGYTEITVQQLIDSEKVDTFVLPDKWCIKGCIAFAKWNGEYREGQDVTDISGKYLNNYYFLKGDSLLKWTYYEGDIPPDRIEITFEQFEKYVLNKSTMDKKVTGYKLLKELPDVAVGAIGRIEGDKVIFDAVADLEWKTRRYTIDTVKNPEWFEAIYEDKFAAGTAIINEDYGIAKIERTDNNTVYLNPGFSAGNINQFSRSSVVGERARKATQEEIYKYLTIIINGYTAKKEDDLITFGCYNFNGQQLLAYKHLLSQDGKLAKITVNDTEITLEIINKLLNLLKWK